MSHMLAGAGARRRGVGRAEAFLQAAVERAVAVARGKRVTLKDLPPAPAPEAVRDAVRRFPTAGVKGFE